MDTSSDLKIVEKYAVRIAIDDGQVLKGSGLIYASNPGKYAMIFTAAHVICDKGKIFENLYLSCKDNNNHCQVIRIKTKQILEKEVSLVEPGNVYIHTNYNSISLNYDAAIICIPWIEWMDEIPVFRIGECKTGNSLLGIGFPESLNGEWKPDGDFEHGGKDTFSGIGFKHTEYSYSVSFELSILRSSGIKIDNVMIGFSGTGLFVRNGNNLEFSGVISRSRGTGTSNNTLWASSAKTFTDIMDKYSLNIVPPSSFEPYIEKITEMFSIHRQEAKDYLVENAYYLVSQNVLPEHILDDSFSDLQCDSERKICDHYFSGQLKKCIILCLINGNYQVEQKRNMVKIPEPYNESVFVEFLCSEANVDDVIGDLVRKKYFAERSILNDGTIFLWNGGIHPNGKFEEFKRNEFRGIITNIADGIRKSSNMNEVLKSFSALLKTKEYKFDIIEGELQEKNFALVCIDKFMHIIENNKGDDGKTKLEIGEELKKIWEI